MEESDLAKSLREKAATFTTEDFLTWKNPENIKPVRYHFSPFC